MKKLYSIFILNIIFILISCNGKEKRNPNIYQGKIERDQISVVSKMAGRILEINVHEGDFIQKGDTLAILDLPEVSAKVAQAEGVVESARAQYEMAEKGATDLQLKQLEQKVKALKEQYDFAQKSILRLDAMLKDSLVPQQQYDEAFAKYQAAQSQYIATEAEFLEAKSGARIEQQKMALGQQEQALGALSEAEIASSERFIIAPRDMQLDGITLKVGELALPGYTLFSGTIKESTYFRFTIPENKLSKIKKGQKVKVKVIYNDEEINGNIVNVKQLGAYANIATAYPDYELQESLFEIKIVPDDALSAADLFNQSNVILNLDE